MQNTCRRSHCFNKSFLAHYCRPIAYIGTVEAGPFGKIDRDLFTDESAYNGYDCEQAIIGYEFKHRFNDVWSLRHNAKYITVDDACRTFFNNGYVETGGVIDHTTIIGTDYKWFRNDYATHIIVMKDGAAVAQGAPKDIVTEQLVESVFGLPCLIIPDPVAGTPLIVPKGRG